MAGDGRAESQASRLYSFMSNYTTYYLSPRSSLSCSGSTFPLSWQIIGSCHKLDIVVFFMSFIKGFKPNKHDAMSP